MAKRTVRMLAVAGPVAATDRSAEQTEVLYVVASDDTLWLGEWRHGVLGWTSLPDLPEITPEYRVGVGGPF